MENAQIKEFLREKLNFSNKSMQKLEIFLRILLKYNSKYNLIAKSTEKIAWERHILDSAQILRLFSRDTREISDLGTGAGFPGVIISIYDEKDKFHVKLYEKSNVKRNFLKLIKKNLNLKFDIYDNVNKYNIESDLIVCRAFKKLDKIIDISREKIKKPHKMIILKGKNAEEELKKISLNRNYNYKLKRSITDKESKIILIDVKK